MPGLNGTAPSVRSPRHFSPSKILVLGFAGVILVGTLLLYLPPASASGRSLSLVDALFTATSAVCVTGLVVVDTADHFSLFGELVVLLLIQAGGLGFMTLSTLVALALGRRITLQDRLVIREGFNQHSLTGVVRLVQLVLVASAGFELLGAALLALRFVPQFGAARGLYLSVFHSVSAFNNAGFDLMGGFHSLQAYAVDPLVNLTVSGLIILGGLGFTVLFELGGRSIRHPLSLHTRLVLSVTGVLLGVGTVLFWLLERHNLHSLGRLTLGGQLLASFFHSVTARTAGFATLNLAVLHPSTLLLLAILMFVGASPGSTGGGVKTSTVGVLLATVWATVHGSGDDVVVLGRRIPPELVRRALAIVVLAVLALLATALLLTATEKQPAFDLLFETISAFGTVGLTTGLTPSLSPVGRLLLVLLMFVGRVGPLTLAASIATRCKSPGLRHAEGRVMVG